MASTVPELAKVEELRKALKLSGKEPAIQILGGVPRAFERFLIAHHNDMDSAAVAMRETLEFREQHKLDAAIAPSPRMAQIAKLWPGDRVCSSVDRSPVYFFGYGHYQPRKLMEEFTPEETTAYYLHFMDQMMRETNSANPSNASSANWIRPIEVHDMKGLTIRDHCIPAALAQLSRNIGLGQKHVPDNIRKAVFINAPLWFSMIWRLLKQVIPTHIQERIEIRSDDGTASLLPLLGGKNKLDEMWGNATRMGFVKYGSSGEPTNVVLEANVDVAVENNKSAADTCLWASIAMGVGWMSLAFPDDSNTLAPCVIGGVALLRLILWAQGSLW